LIEDEAVGLKQIFEDIFGSRSAASQHDDRFDEPLQPQEYDADPWVRGAGAQAADAAPYDAQHRPTRSSPQPPGPAVVREGGFAALLVGALVSVVVLGLALSIVASSVSNAGERLTDPDVKQKPVLAIAQEAEVAYCTPEFKEVLERVLHSCGLAGGEQRRGCKPSDIKTFAAISDQDFNALFQPLKDRGGVLLFDEGSDELDAAAKELLDQRWIQRRGARYFFVVARASKTGTPAKNRALSHRRANSVLFHLEKTSGESKADLDKRVGLLWLGNEFAQLSEDYCAWPSSRSDDQCGPDTVNRSAFVSWVDCRL
jgi:outer membrane protein OmpA-like peptidoglycan-associated protein